MDPVTAMALVSIGSNLLGGLFGSHQQSAANAANKFLTGQTNELNEKLFHENLDFQREMFNKTNEWNMPENQKNLLKQAGFNPALLFGQNGQSLAHAPSPVGTPQMQTANMMPVDAFANSIKNMGVELANGYLSMAQAEKAKNEAVGQSIDNRYKAQHHALDLASKGAVNEGQKLLNEYNQRTMEARVEKSNLDNAFLSENIKNLVADTALKNVTASLESEKIKLTQTQVQELDALIKKHLAEADYYVSQKELNSILKNESASRIALNYVNAEMSKLVGNAQAGMYSAQSGVYGQQARYTAEDARLLEKFGEQIKRAGIQVDKTAADVNVATKVKVMREVKKLDKDLHWYDFDEIWGAFTDWLKSVSPSSGYR